MGALGGGVSLGTLFVEIVAKVDEALKGIQQFGHDVSSELDKQKEKWKGLKDVGESMTTMGAGLTAGLTLPIAGIGAAAIKSASDFESSLNKITAVGGQTGDDLEKLRAQAMKLGADTKYSAQEAAEGMGNLAAAGQNTTQIMQSMPGVLDLAAAGELSVSRAAEVTTDTLGQFGMAADQAGRIADVMAASAAASSINVQQVAEAMKYAGPIAQSAGVSFEDTATAIALLGNAGIKGEQAGTSLRGIMSSLIDPSKEAQKAISALGVTTTDAAGKMLPLDQVFAQLKEHGATTADMFTIFGQNAASAAAALTQDAGPAWAAMTAEIDKSDGAAKKMADTLNSGVKGGFEQLKGSVDTALIALGTSLLPIVLKLVEAGTNFINNWILPAVEAFGKLDPTLQTIIIAFVGLLAALGPVLVIAGSIVTAISTLAPIFAVAGGAIAAFAGLLSAPVLAIAAVTAALVALGVWVYKNWDTIVAALASAWDTIKQTWEAVWGAIVGAVTAVWDGFKAIVGPYWKFLTDLIGAVWNVVTAVWEAEWKAIVKVVTVIWDAIEPYVRPVFEAIVKFLTGLWDDVKKDWDTIWGAIKKAVTFVWDAFKTGANTVFTPLAKMLAALWDDVKAGWILIWENLKTTVLGIWDKIKVAVGKFTDALGTIKSVVTGIPGALNSVATSIRNVGNEADKAAGHSPVPELADALGNVKTVATDLPKPLGDSATGIGGVAQAAGNLATLLIDKLIPHAGTAKTAVGDVGTAADQTAPKIGGIHGAITTVLGSLTSLSTDGPAAMGKTMTGIAAKVDDKTTGLPGITDEFSKFATTAGGAIEGFATGAVKSLFEGDTSFGEKGKALLKTLGGAVKDDFIKPAEAAITNFIEGAIKDLLSGKGLGGVLDSLKEIGSKAADVFSSTPTPGVPSTGGGVPSTGGGGAPGGGAGGAVSGGLTGWIGAIGSAVTAISSVIGNFQMAKMETTLNAIEHSTRYSELYLGSRGDGGILGILFRIDEEIAWGAQTKATENLRDLFKDWSPWVLTDLDKIKDHTNDGTALLQSLYDATLAAGTAQGALFDKLVAAVEQLVGIEQQNVTYNLNGTDPSLVAANIGRRMRLQGAFA